MTATASCSQPPIEACRTYWFEAKRELIADFTACPLGSQATLQCMLDRLKGCKGQTLIDLTSHLPKPLTEIEEKMLWYAAFGVALEGARESLPKPVIRASFLQWLLTNPMVVKLIHTTGIQVSKITIENDLDLASATIGFPLLIEHSLFQGGIILIGAKTRNVSFEGSTCDYIKAEDIRIRGSLKLTRGFVAKQGVHLSKASLSGDLDCGDGHFFCESETRTKREKMALTLNRAVVGGGVFLNDGFTADGGVSLEGAEIGGNLDCSGGSFKNLGDETTVGHQEVYALDMSLAKIHGHVLLSSFSEYRTFKALGQVLALGMVVDGNFDCTQGNIDNQAGTYHAMSIDHSSIAGSIFLRNGFSAHGQVRLIGTKISGDLDCSGGTFLINEEAKALAPEGRKEAVAIEARNAEIHDCVYLSSSLWPCRFGDKEPKPFETDGDVNFGFAHIGCDLIIGESEYNRRSYKRIKLNDNAINTFDICNAKIEGYLRCIEQLHGANLLLDNTTVGGLIAPAEARWWPAALSLRNCFYKYISFRAPGGHDYKKPNYLEWIARGQDQKQEQDTFDPQIHKQLAAVLYQGGQHTDATRVLMNEEDRRIGNMKWRQAPIERAWRRFLGYVMGHGYKPLRIFYVALFIIGIGAGSFHYGDENGLMVPAKKGDIGSIKNLDAGYTTANSNFEFGYYDANGDNSVDKACHYKTGDYNLPSYHPQFNPVVYSLDVFLPIGTLQQRDHWQPYDRGCGKLNLIGGIHILRWWYWAEVLLGWLCVTLGLAGLTGLIRKSGANL